MQYRPIRLATSGAGLYPWLIRRPVRECVTWALRTCVIKIVIIKGGHCGKSDFSYHKELLLKKRMRKQILSLKRSSHLEKGCN